MSYLGPLMLLSLFVFFSRRDMEGKKWFIKLIIIFIASFVFSFLDYLSYSTVNNSVDLLFIFYKIIGPSFFCFSIVSIFCYLKGKKGEHS
ncbi:hypothetical protein [Xenorhabdus bovienii]|uniref:hypothetical protein n=1 Tax=Xenorhabdus bovienii TaxID=40576 RepID=UPI0020CA99BB|nr:hypothetical protein [Xenorhabdus bovienii]